jgi:hypothetical protein
MRRCSALLGLELDDSGLVKQTRERESYGVFVGDWPVGRYTIRKEAGGCERNLLCIYSTAPGNPEILPRGSYGCGGYVFWEPVRILAEHAIVIALSLSDALRRHLTKAGRFEAAAMVFEVDPEIRTSS